MCAAILKKSVEINIYFILFIYLFNILFKYIYPG